MDIAILEFFNNSNKKLVIFGMGRRGKILSEHLNKRISYLIDNDPTKWEEEFCGHKISSPAILQNEKADDLFIIVVSYYYLPIKWQLKSMGFHETVHFINGLEIFGDYLNSKFPQNQVSLDLSEKVWLRGNPNIDGQSRFQGNNAVLEGSRIINTKVDIYSHIGRNCTISNATIGKFVQIASEVMIGLEAHPSRGFISTHQIFHRDKPSTYFSFVEKKLFEDIIPVAIGNDVWIGAKAVIHAGITIGDGAVIGAGAVVTRDVDPYSVIGGIPAKLIRKRYSEEQIQKLLKFKWWNHSIDWIRKHALLFSNEDAFFEMINKMSSN